MGDLAFLNIDPNEQPAESSFDPLPAGTYECMIESAEVKQTKDFTGQYLNLRLQVISGQFENRLIFDRITIANRNENAVRIGREQIIRLVRAAGVSGKDSAEFGGKVVLVKVGIKQDAQYGPQNTVKEYLSKTVGTPSGAPVVKRTVVHRSPDIAQPADGDDEPPY